MANEDPLVARLRMEFDGQPIVATFTVPAGPVPYRSLQKHAHEATDLMISIAEGNETKAGRKISCAKGCSACCHQLPPVALSEARHLAALVDAMPEPRRTQVRERFAAAVRRATDAGLIERLRGTADLNADELLALGLEYFRLGIDCPFLEDAACSIHVDRPTECREYLVTSPPANCRELAPGAIQAVKLPAKVSRAVRVMDRQAYGGTDKSAWIPLLLSLEWAAAHPEEPPPRPGPELLQAFVQALRNPSVEGEPNVS